MRLSSHIKSDSRKIAFWVITAWLLLIPIANAAHAADHDFLASETACHICNHSIFDDLAIANSMAEIVVIKVIDSVIPNNYLSTMVSWTTQYLQRDKRDDFPGVSLCLQIHFFWSQLKLYL